ncbi:MAG: MEDS domain-containing protein [Candidatus Omnitrophica bacterium]|nr:MEDS domain-containing protein [Candidatus Omnitrophota bacterium]
MVSLSNFDSLYDVSSGKHFYQFYKSSDDFLHVMIPFFQAGLEKNDACLWLISQENSLDFCRSTAEAMIPQHVTAILSGQFQILSAEEWYLTEGTFDESKAIANALQHLEKIKALGFRRFRIAGDEACVPRKDWSLVEAYERKVAPWIKSQPIVALCAYPILSCTPPAKPKRFSSVMTTF